MFRVRGRKIDWRHRQKRTSFDGMHTLSSSEDEDPITFLPDERWELEDVDTGRPDRGPDSSPLERFTGTFDACLPQQPSTLSSAYSQRGVEGFRKCIQSHTSGHISLDLSGRLGCAEQVDLLPELMHHHAGQTWALTLSNNALKAAVLPAVSKLVSAFTCVYMDLSENSGLLSTALCPLQSAALSSFFNSNSTSPGLEDSDLADGSFPNTRATHDVDDVAQPTVLSTLLLNSCKIHQSAAEVVATSLLHQCPQPCDHGDEETFLKLRAQHDESAVPPSKPGQERCTRRGLNELHLGSASFDDAAFAALLSPRSFTLRCGTG